MAKIVGRLYEQAELQRYVESKSSEFVAVFGRRRVGKTFLVREFFQNRFAFYLTGLANANTKSQLINFQLAMRAIGDANATVPQNWFYAFEQLRSLIEASTDEKKVIFLDELPWIDTPKSDFMSALEHFWNAWASQRSDILLVVCGSSTSWMMDKLLNNKGGLHNRITRKLKINPFTLLECKQFLQEQDLSWDEYQITESYMILGGIPYYWSLLQKGLSLAQNVDALFFQDNGVLRNEFQNLYAALFKHSEKYTHVVDLLSKKNKGLTRKELIAAGKGKSGGGLSKILEDLEYCGFIRSYVPIDKKQINKTYQLTDFYSLFYYRFIKDKNKFNENYWSTQVGSSQHAAWTGYAFEQLCLAHVVQIKKSLGISGVHCNVATWRSKESENGAQIDLLIDRNDSVINLCEMKYSIRPFTIDKKYAENLRNKIGAFKDETKTHKSVFLTFVSTFGVAQNEYAGMVQNEVMMPDLFA